MYRVEVIADSSGKWCGNRLTYDTVESAREAARDLKSRWSAVRLWRVVDQRGTAVWDEQLGPVDQPERFVNDSP